MNQDRGIPREAVAALVVGVALAGLTLLVYCPCFDHPFVRLDDQDYVTRNPHVQAGLTADGVRWAFTTFACGNWHPLTWLSLELDATLYGGRNAGGFHLTNVLLHAANAVVLFLVLNRMTGAVWRSGAVAALFALHPLHVESVAWVAERKDTLSALFWVLTLAAYVWYVRRPEVGRYLLVVATFALGLMAKPMLVTLPCVLLLLDYWPLRRWRPALGRIADPSGKQGGLEIRPTEERAPAPPPATPFRTLLLEKVPLFALALASCVLTFVAQSRDEAVQSFQAFPSGVRVANALLAYVGYLGKAFWPVDLAVYYPHPGAGVSVAGALGAGALLLGLTALALGPGRRRPYLAVGWLWYLGTLVPVIGLVQVGGQAMADRYTYVPLVGLFLLVTWGAADLAGALRLSGFWPAAAAAVALSACVALTWAQLGYWGSDRDLWEHALAVTGPNQYGHCSLAECLEEEGDLDAARRHYQQAVAVDPGQVRPHNSLGNVLRKLGRTDEAAAQYRTALQLDPTFALAHYNLGLVLTDAGRTDEAAAEFRQAVALDPGLLPARCDLGMCYYGQGRLGEAVAEFEAAVALDPQLPATHSTLGNLLAELGRSEEAAAEYRTAVRLDPGLAAAHYNLGLVLADLGQLEEARAEYRRALELGAPRAADQLRACDRLRGLRARLPALLDGRDRPADAAERLAFADLCRRPAEGRYALAARLYAEAFAADPALADDARAGHRYAAACAAVLAGQGRGADAAGLGEGERARLRDQGRAWLRAELARYDEDLAGRADGRRAAVRRRLERWRHDPDLAGVRDPAALADLPEAERRQWQDLWRDVAAALARCGPAQPAPAQPAPATPAHGAIVRPGTTVSTASAPSLPSSTTMCRSPFRPVSTWAFPDGQRIVRLSTSSASARPKWTTFGACER
jgi:tetratricopeptide (TPR) repeat protein